MWESERAQVLDISKVRRVVFYRQPRFARRAETLWAVYLVTRAEDIRNELLEMYYPLAKNAAREMKIVLKKVVSWEWLHADATYGLLKAIMGYTPEKGASFVNYAFIRMRGTILDGLREMDPISRFVRRAIKHMQEIVRKNHEDDGPPLSTEELSRVSGMSIESCRQVAHIHEDTKTVSVEMMLGDARDVGLNPVEHADPFAFADKGSDFGFRDVVARDFRHWLFAQIKNQRWKYIAEQYFVEGRLQADIGREEGVTESRVSEIITECRVIWRERSRVLFQEKG